MYNSLISLQYKHQFKTTYTDCFYQYSPDYLSTGFSSHQVLPFHTDLVPKNKNKKTLNYNKGYSYHNICYKENVCVKLNLEINDTIIQSRSW